MPPASETATAGVASRHDEPGDCRGGAVIGAAGEAGHCRVGPGPRRVDRDESGDLRGVGVGSGIIAERQADPLEGRPRRPADAGDAVGGAGDRPAERPARIIDADLRARLADAEVGHRGGPFVVGAAEETGQHRVAADRARVPESAVSPESCATLVYVPA